MGVDLTEVPDNHNRWMLSIKEEEREGKAEV